MNDRVNHMRACLIALGHKEDSNWNVIWLRLAMNPNHPDRVAIESRFGSIFPKGYQIPRPVIEDVCAVTSMSPSATRLQRQLDVVRSWKQLGLKVVSVNTTAEIRTMSGSFPDVEFVANDRLPSLFKRRSQSIKGMVDIGRTVADSVLLINSDIETIGSFDVVQKCVVSRKPMVGIRHNYDTEIGASRLELWGIDVFLVPPHVEVPELGFAIGRPMWDYWMCWVLENSGPVEWVGKPLFYHKSHELNWSTSEWTIGSDEFMNHYGVDVDWERWRRDRPFGVNHFRNIARLDSSDVEGSVPATGS